MTQGLPFHLVDGRSAMDSLSLAHDGPIPEPFKAIARAWDARHPLMRTDFSVRLGRCKLKRWQAIEVMAEEIVRQAGLKGSVEAADFLRLGFESPQIEALAATAFRYATARHPGLAHVMTVPA